jgi:hypothetical protein
MSEIETVCEEAQRIVYGDREATYGKPSKNFDATAKLWNAHLSAKYGISDIITAHDVAWMMMQLKQAREMHQHKRDNIVDAIGYVACCQKMIDFDDEAARDALRQFDPEPGQKRFVDVVKDILG